MDHSLTIIEVKFTADCTFRSSVIVAIFDRLRRDHSAVLWPIYEILVLFAKTNSDHWLILSNK